MEQGRALGSEGLTVTSLCDLTTSCECKTSASSSKLMEASSSPPGPVQPRVCTRRTGTVRSGPLLGDLRSSSPSTRLARVNLGSVPDN